MSTDTPKVGKAEESSTETPRDLPRRAGKGRAGAGARSAQREERLERERLELSCEMDRIIIDGKTDVPDETRNLRAIQNKPTTIITVSFCWL